MEVDERLELVDDNFEEGAHEELDKELSGMSKLLLVDINVHGPVFLIATQLLGHCAHKKFLSCAFLHALFHKTALFLKDAKQSVAKWFRDYMTKVLGIDFEQSLIMRTRDYIST